MRKGQTALEYLMTYGWAILIVIIAIGALYAFGLTKPCRWTGTQVSGFIGGGFEVSTPRFDASDKQLVFDLKRIGAGTVTVPAASSGTATYGTETVTWSIGVSDWTAKSGDIKTVTITFVTSTPSAGNCYSTDVVINYQEAGRSFTSVGKVSGTIES